MGQSDNGSFQIAKHYVIGSDHGKIDFHALLHDRIGKPFCNPFSVFHRGQQGDRKQVKNCSIP